MVHFSGFGKVYAAVKKGENPPVKYAIKEVGPKGGKTAELEAKRMRQFDHKVSSSNIPSVVISSRLELDRAARILRMR